MLREPFLPFVQRGLWIELSGRPSGRAMGALLAGTGAQRGERPKDAEETPGPFIAISFRCRFETQTHPFSRVLKGKPPVAARHFTGVQVPPTRPRPLKRPRPGDSKGLRRRQARAARFAAARFGGGAARFGEVVEQWPGVGLQRHAGLAAPARLAAAKKLGERRSPQRSKRYTCIYIYIYIYMYNIHIYIYICFSNKAPPQQCVVSFLLVSRFKRGVHC